MANLIRLKQIESGSSLGTAAQVGQDFSQSVINIITSEVAAALPDGVISSSAQVYITGTIGYTDIATDLEVAVISSSLSASQTLISSSISSSIAATLSGSAISVTNLSASVSTSLSLLSSSIQSVTGDFSASVARTFATQSSNITSVSSSLNVFTSSIGLTIKAKMNTENVITSSRQLDGSVINNLTLGTTGDNYSLIVSGALAVVDADIIISGTQYNVGGQIWVNGQTGSAGNPPEQPYDNTGQPQSDIIDQGEW
jgi:hypothetical protein